MWARKTLPTFSDIALQNVLGEVFALHAKNYPL